MKLFGERPTPTEDCIILPMGNGFVCLRARASADPAKFEKVCPEPEPPAITKPGGAKSVDLNDRGYLKLLADRNKLYFSWVILESLKPTQGLEWETVKEGDPTTWSNVEKELLEAFGQQGFARIVDLVNEVNLVTDDKLKEAKARFLALPGEDQERLSFLNTALKSTVSGEAANG